MGEWRCGVEGAEQGRRRGGGVEGVQARGCEGTREEAPACRWRWRPCTTRSGAARRRSSVAAGPSRRAAHSPWQAHPKNRVPDVQIITQTKSSLSSCWRWSASAASPWTPLRALCGQGEGGRIGGPKINPPPAREENTTQRCKLAHVHAHMHAHKDHTHKDHTHLPAPAVAQTSRSARTSRLAP